MIDVQMPNFILAGSFWPVSRARNNRGSGTGREAFDFILTAARTRAKSKDIAAIFNDVFRHQRFAEVEAGSFDYGEHACVQDKGLSLANRDSIRGD
jgi:hypothetical protein